MLSATTMYTNNLKEALTAPYGYEETLSLTWPRNMCIYSASLVSASYGKDWHLLLDNSFLTFSNILQSEKGGVSYDYN